MGKRSNLPKRKQLHETAHLKVSQPTPGNITSLGNARSALKETYAAEQTIYLQSKIDQITSAVSNKKAAIAWKTVNEISGRKSCTRAKLKASSQEERLQLWKKHFEDLLGKPPAITEEEIAPIIVDELNIKKGPFEMNELLKAVKGIQNGKACGLDEIPAEVWKLEGFHPTLLKCCNNVIAKTP